VKENFVKDLSQQSETTEGQHTLKEKRYIYFISRRFCCVLHIPPHENDTVEETGGSKKDVNSESPIYEEQWFNSKQNLQSYSGSRTGGKSTGRGKRKENILLTTTA
jgi:hypothetical protein